MRRFIDSKLFPLVSLFICARCFNPLEDGQYDINWGGPIVLGEDQVAPVSMKILQLARLLCSTVAKLSIPLAIP